MMYVRSSRARIAGLAGLLAIATAPAATVAAVAPVGQIQDLNQLPPATEITLPSGRKATIATLQAEHAARLARLAGAQPPGDSKPPGGPKAIVKNFSHSGFAADYASFCNAAKAAVCLFAPGPGAYFIEHGVIEDFDFFMTQGQCTQYQGVWTPAGTLVNGYGSHICTLTYPVAASIHFDAGLPPDAAQFSSTCMKADDAFTTGYTGRYDPHGYFEATFVTDSTPFGRTLTLSKTTSCVTQIEPK